MCFILINSCIIFQINFFKELHFNNIFQKLKLNYLYVYKKEIILKISCMKFYYISQWYETLWYKKASDNPKKIKWYRDMIKSITQHSYFEKKPNKQMGRLQNNPSIGNLDLVNFCSCCSTIDQWKREFWWLELFVFVQKHMLVFLCFANVAIFIFKNWGLPYMLVMGNMWTIIWECKAHVLIHDLTLL